jgi:hypothetical protein
MQQLESLRSEVLSTIYVHRHGRLAAIARVIKMLTAGAAAVGAAVGAGPALAHSDSKGCEHTTHIL